MQLCSKGQYQNALILHLMYSLSLDPYHIFSLRYEDILSKDQIQYWDYRTSSKKTCYLYYELWSDINIIKRYQEFEKGECRSTARVMIDKTKIKGCFIIDISPTNIYNRFHRKFSNTINDFNFTPNDIVQLSNLSAQIKSSGCYNRSLLKIQASLNITSI